jgi:hypothetical protein
LGHGLISAAALFLAACSGDGSSVDDTGAVVPPYSGDTVAQPAPPAAPPENETPATSGIEQSSGIATPPSNSEGPPADSNTPVAPPQNTDTNAGTSTPPQQTPPQQPPQQTPPQQTPPQQTPPQQTPPQQTPPPAGRTQVFLLFGQSNMYGVPRPEQQDMEINPRVEVLTMTTCSKHGTNQWVPAQPPLHGCVGQPGTGGTGPGVGPGDYFAKTLANAFPQDTILLVPGAVPGVSINTFQPGQANYNNLLARAKMAQQRGEIRGMIFHQGESDSNQRDWPTRVKTVVDRLRSDLAVPSAPFVAGELWYQGCCAAHNALVNQLPSVITNAAVAKADGLSGLPASYDMFGTYHFDLPSQRTLGQRYAQAMLPLLQR